MTSGSAFRPDTADRRLVIIGRTATFLSFVLGIVLVPLLDRYESIFAATNDVIAHIAPPITCVFLLGVFWGRASGRSASIPMWLGSALGVLLYALKTLHAWRPDAFDWIHPFFYETPFMMMAFYMFCARAPCNSFELLVAEASRRGPSAALLGSPAGRLEIGRLARVGRLSLAGGVGRGSHGRPLFRLQRAVTRRHTCITGQTQPSRTRR